MHEKYILEIYIMLWIFNSIKFLSDHYAWCKWERNLSKYLPSSDNHTVYIKLSMQRKNMCEDFIEQDFSFTSRMLDN